MSNTPKVVLWDVEVSGIVATTWNLYPESISHENMIEDWFMISVAWKELGKKKIEAVSVLDDPKRFEKNCKDDYHVIKTVREMLEDVDVLIAHNGDRFDLKSFNARLIYHSLPPLKKILTVDTLKEAKKVAKFTSNRLDFLAKIFSGEGKMHTPPGTWLKAMNGDIDAIKLMVRYNKEDIRALEDVYLRLLPYMKSHPNLAEPLTLNCPKCGSDDYKKNGIEMRATGARVQTYQCKSCGARYSDTKTIEKPNSKL